MEQDSETEALGEISSGTLRRAMEAPRAARAARRAVPAGLAEARVITLRLIDEGLSSGQWTGFTDGTREEGRRRDPPLARSVTRPHWIKRNFRVGPAGGRGARAVPGCAYIARAPGDGHGGGHGVGSGVNRRVRSSQCAEQSPAAVEPRGHGPLQSLELTLSYLSLYHISTVTNHEFQDRRFEMSTREQSAKSENKTSTAFLGSRTAAARVLHAPEVRLRSWFALLWSSPRRSTLFIASGVPLWEERRIHADTI